MASERRSVRIASDAVALQKLHPENDARLPITTPEHPPKQTRMTDVFPVRKGPAPGQKEPKTPVVKVTAPRTTAATERTKARAARTAAATQSAGPPAGRKRRPRVCSDDEVLAVPMFVATPGVRRSSRSKPSMSVATAAPTASARPATAGTMTGAKNAKAAAAAAVGPAQRRRRGAANTASSMRYLSSWEVDGEEYRAGDDVYVVETDDLDKLPEDDGEACSICTRTNNPNRMVECDRCLRGFHFRCLKPPLKSLPDGDWLCPDCEKGVPPNAAGRRLTTSCQTFLFGEKVLGLARITGWVRDRQGEVQVIVRHYKKPEETHLGRQKHHHSREVFLGVAEHQEPIGCIWGRAQVVQPGRFAETEGTDVFICEYEYDDKWKRFRRRLGLDDGGAAAASDDDDEWGASAASGAAGRGRGAQRGGAATAGAISCDDSDEEDDGGDSDRDAEYKPKNTLDGWVIRKPRPGQQLQKRTSGRSRAHSYKAIIDEHGTGLLLDQGATVVPDRGPVGPLEVARRALALNNCLGGLPCRETEKQALRRFIGQSVESGDSPGVLYICGVPGTGKTACVMEVLGGVRAQAQSSGVQLVILNALQLPSPQHVYSKLWERMSGQRWGPARALKALEETFSGGVGAAGGSGRRHMTLLIVDEIDVLITKDQAVLYNLFEWPMREGSRLAVIGISNTHDLDSRVLPRIASRLAGSKLAFNPYNFEQLKEILNNRLQGVTAVAKGALDFCARKVASTTGDVRRALELLRRAIEIAEGELAAQAQRQLPGAAGSSATDLTNAVGVRQATAAIKEMYGSVHMTLLRAAGLYQKLLLVALLMETRALNKPEVTVAALHHRLVSHLGLLTKDAALPLSRVVEAAAALGSQRLVIADAAWLGPGMRLTLNVPQDDVVALLREDPSLTAVQSCLA